MDQRTVAFLRLRKKQTPFWRHFSNADRSAFPDSTEQFTIQNHKQCEKAVYDNSTILKHLRKEEEPNFSQYERI